MAVKTVEMVRKIRDKHYETIKRLSFADQLEFIKKKRDRLHKELKRSQGSIADNKRTIA